MSGVKEIQEAEFKTEVLDSPATVMVDFFSTWCPPCSLLAPALDGIAAKYSGRLKIVKVNVDDSRQLAVDNGIRGVPTLMFFKQGKVFETMVGLPHPDTLREKLDAITKAPANAGAAA